MGGVEKDQGVIVIEPFNSIKGLFQVNLEDCVGLIPFYLPKVAYVLLDNDRIVSNPLVS